MTTLYARIAGPILRTAALFTAFSTPTPTVYRGSSGDPTQDATQSAAGARTAYLIHNAGSKMQQAASGAGVLASDWLIYAPIGTGPRAGDVLSDGTRAARLMAAPENDLGFLLAPAELVGVPAGAVVPSQAMLDFSKASNSGYIGLTL